MMSRSCRPNCRRRSSPTAARLGVNEYLVKPVSAKSLYDRLVSITLQPRPTVQLGDYYGPEPRKLAGEAVDDANLATSLVPPLVV